MDPLLKTQHLRHTLIDIYFDGLSKGFTNMEVRGTKNVHNKRDEPHRKTGKNTMAVLRPPGSRTTP